MKHLLKLITGILLLTGNDPARAQFHAPGGLPPGFHHALLDVFSGGPSFYGRATVQVANGADKDPTSITCNIAVLSGAMRLEADSFEAGANVPSAEAARLKSMHSITILRPDRNRMYMVYPDYKAYVELGCSKNTNTDALPAPTITKTPPAKDKVGDETCQKSDWNMTEVDGEQYGATVWASTNLGGFPIQIKIGQPAALVVFQDLHLEPPNASLFEPPSGYTKYEGIPVIIQKEVEKANNANSQ